MAVTVETFDTPGTFTGGSGWLCPPNVTTVKVRTWGGGGGGGGGQTGIAGGAGAGGGAYSEKTITGLTPGNRYDFQVGAGGAGGTTNATGSTGVDSYFIDTSTCLAKGGVGGGHGLGAAGGNGGAAGSGVGDLKTSGGNGAQQASNNGGRGGGSGGAGGAGGNATTSVVGAAGAADANGDGAGAAGDGATGGQAPEPGGGGRGGQASGGASGDQGGDGRVQIEYTQTQTVTDNVGITDSVQAFLLEFDPEGLFNDAYDQKWNGDQVYEVYLDGNKVWDWVSPYAYTVEQEPEVARQYSFVVPDGCYEVAFFGGGACGGQGVGTGGSIGGVGGRGSLMSGRIPVEPGDLITGYVGNRGANGAGTDPPGLGQGGEPGGAGSSMNYALNVYGGFGGTGGGMTCIYVNHVLKVVIAGGGGGGAGLWAVGGAGGHGGGDVGQAGHNGVGGADPAIGGGGGTQSAGGAGGNTSATPAGNNRTPSFDGVYLGGGTTFRNGPYGSGVATDPHGGGGGGGYYGGGGGGNGGGTSLTPYSAAGGGGGSDFYDDDIDITTQVQGGNTGNDYGFLAFSFFAKRTYIPDA